MSTGRGWNYCRTIPFCILAFEGNPFICICPNNTQKGVPPKIQMLPYRGFPKDKSRPNCRSSGTRFKYIVTEYCNRDACGTLLLRRLTRRLSFSFGYTSFRMKTTETHHRLARCMLCFHLHLLTLVFLGPS